MCFQCDWACLCVDGQQSGCCCCLTGHQVFRTACWVSSLCVFWQTYTLWCQERKTFYSSRNCLDLPSVPWLESSLIAAIAQLQFSVALWPSLCYIEWVGGEGMALRRREKREQAFVSLACPMHQPSRRPRCSWCVARARHAVNIKFRQRWEKEDRQCLEITPVVCREIAAFW